MDHAVKGKGAGLVVVTGEGVGLVPDELVLSRTQVAPNKYKLHLRKRMICRIGLLSWDGAIIPITRQITSLQFNN